MATVNLKNVSLDFPLTTHKLKRKSDHKIFNSATGGVVSTSLKNKMSIRALEDISLSLKPGDSLALLGHNGAGKTTLLRVMAGLYAPTDGEVSIKGRVAPLLNLSFGIDMEATGYENIWTRGLYLGMSRAEIKNKIDEIADFSGLDEFLSLPIRTYSSGMKARLAFAISTHVEADILLLDEVVATGDASFFQQANRRIEEFCSQSKIMVLASHSNKMLRNLCNKGLLLEHGKVRAFGPIDDVIQTYETNKNIRPLYTDRAAINQKKVGSSLENIPFRIMLINDGENLSDPGSRLVRKAYKLIFDKKINHTLINSTTPIGYWEKEYQQHFNNKDCIIKNNGDYLTSFNIENSFDYNEWENIRMSLVNSDEKFIHSIKNNECLVINVIQNINDNTYQGLALLAIIKTAIELGKKVFLFNAIISQGDPKFIISLFSNVSFIHVRDSSSQNFLSSLGINSIHKPDIGLLSLEEDEASKIKLLDASNYILVTSSKLFDVEILKLIFYRINKKGMKALFFYFGENCFSLEIEELCNKYGVPVVDASKMLAKEHVGFIKQFSIAITDSHYLNLYMMRCGVPFINFSSNILIDKTSLSDMGYIGPCVSSIDEVIESLDLLTKNYDQILTSCNDAYSNGVLELKELLNSIDSKLLYE